MYGVFETTNSRVPSTRPGLPIAGKTARRSVAAKMSSTMRSAALGLSRAMYSASAFRSARARLSHSTHTAFPLRSHRRYFVLSGEVSRIRLSNSSLYFRDLPLVEGDVFPDGFSSEERTTALRGLRQLIKLFLELAIDPKCENV